MDETSPGNVTFTCRCTVR